MSRSSAILVEHGQCSHRDDDGKRCRSRRYTRTTEAMRKRPGYCRKHEPDYLQGVDMKERIAEFVAQVQPDPVTGCWYWRGSTTGNRRGRFKAGGITWLPYRFAFAAFFGGHKNGTELSHLCGGGGPGNGRGSCCNPAHLLPTGKTLHRRYKPSISRVNLEVASRDDGFFAAFCEENGLPVGWCSRLPESLPATSPATPSEVPDTNDTAVYPTVSLVVSRRDAADRPSANRVRRRRPVPPGRPGRPSRFCASGPSVASA